MQSSELQADVWCRFRVQAGVMEKPVVGDSCRTARDGGRRDKG